MMDRQNISLLVILIELLLAVGSNGVCSSGNCHAHDICVKDSDCAAGLRCTNCSSADEMNYRCTRFCVTDPVSQIQWSQKVLVGGLPFNKYSWLTTHNSFAIVGEKSYTGTERIADCNQEDSVTDQLNNGVRGLMLDMYDFENAVWLCHSNGTCFNVTAFMPAINTLKEIATFLAANPSEIITIFIEDYVKAPKGLTKVFTAAGLMKYWFPVSRMPQNGEDWPTVNDMVTKNQRLIVFTSQSSKEASEGIAYEWKYVVENQYGDEGLLNGSCVNREESENLTSKSQSLFLENFFPTIPSIPESCSINSDSLSNMLGVCYEKAGKRWANFLAVNFYKRSYGGGAFQAVDKLNGQLICGRNDITECQANGTSGVYKASNNNICNTKVSQMDSAAA